MEEDEEDRLDMAFDVKLASRLGCQSKIESEGEITIQVSEEGIEAFLAERSDWKDPS
jgi:ferredoxin